MKFSQAAYNERLNAIFSKSPSVQNVGFAANSYKPGLEGMRAFAAAMGNPQRNFKSIHVAGTNGKGSVSSMLAANLAANGLRVGLYTSPHLVDFRERIKVSNPAACSPGVFEMIPEEAVWDFLESYKSEIETLSFFEITTGLCLWWFSKCKVDVAVIEVGLGGRLDSTNIIEPELSIVTSIGLDHCALLGDTRAKIAAEKAGIFKRGVAALVGFKDSETAPVFEEKAQQAGAHLHFVQEGGYRQQINELLPQMDLKGHYQARNLRTVLTALEIMDAEPCCLALCRTAAITGLRGRWEILSREPLTIADIGHNPAALALNFKQLEAMDRPLIIVYGIMADKDLDTITDLLPSKAKYILCAPQTPRALPVVALRARIMEARPGLDCVTAASVKDAVEAAKALATPQTVIYIGGSAFVVAEAI